MYQSPNKTGGCFRCHELGHWARDCPKSPATRSPITQNRSPISTSDYPPTHCICGAGFCEIRVSSSQKNPDRHYYCCPGKYENHCDYFQWCDELKKDDILVVQPQKSPICACGAGVCRVMTEKYGPTAGRSCFVCPIKKGYGACNFKQWKDDDSEYLLEYLSLEAEMAIDANVKRALDFSSQNDQVQMDNGLDDSPGLPLHSVANNIPGKALAPELLRMDDSQGESITGGATTIQDPTSLGFNPLNMPEDNSPSESSLNLLEVPKQSVLKNRQNEGIYEALEKLLCLQKDIIPVSETTGLNNHEGVSREHCTFTPLDYLRADFGLFHLQAVEYIKQATAHACIEQAIKDDATSRELLDLYNKEKTRFGETFRSFCEAGKAYMTSHERLISSREEVSRVRERVVDLEDEVMCCEVENAHDKETLLRITKTISECREMLVDLEDEVMCCEVENVNNKKILLQMTKSMSECKESMQNAYKKVEDAFKQL